MIKKYFFLLFLLLIFLLCCTEHVEKNIPRDKNVLVELGHYLFFDTRLSVTKTKSCASCHNPRFAFTDGYRKTLGAFADIHTRNTPGLINVTINKYFNWANPSVTRLEQQMEQPLFSHQVIEMGLMPADTTAILESIQTDAQYALPLAAIFPGGKTQLSWALTKKAIAAYVASLQSYNAPYDRYKKGDSSAISLSAKKGETLFFSERLHCNYCHTPPHFGVDSSLKLQQQFADIGLYNPVTDSFTNFDWGLYNETGVTADKGKFRIPALRNLSFTAPYFHDGSAETLEDALDVFEKGGRVITQGIYTGDGRKHVNKNQQISGYTLSKEEKLQLVNFLLSLDDSTILTNPRFNDPFKNNRN